MGQVYGNTEIWGLGYSSPFTSSSHYIMVSNESNFTARYLYEFKASILEVNFEVRVPTNPTHQHIEADEVVVESETLSINLDNFPQIGQNELFTLDCYTRIDIVTKFNGSAGWSVGLRHRYLK